MNDIKRLSCSCLLLQDLKQTCFKWRSTSYIFSQCIGQPPIPWPAYNEEEHNTATNTVADSCYNNEGGGAIQLGAPMAAEDVEYAHCGIAPLQRARFYAVGVLPNQYTLLLQALERHNNKPKGRWVTVQRNFSASTFIHISTHLAKSTSAPMPPLPAFTLLL